jgi:hypothetical protein
MGGTLQEIVATEKIRDLLLTENAVEDRKKYKLNWKTHANRIQNIKLLFSRERRNVI